MIIPEDGDADLLTVLSRLSSCHAKLAGTSTPLSSLSVGLSSNGLSLSSAFGNSCE
jgi:hypothetical protein